MIRFYLKFLNKVESLKNELEIIGGLPSIPKKPYTLEEYEVAKKEYASKYEKYALVRDSYYYNIRQLNKIIKEIGELLPEKDVWIITENKEFAVKYSEHPELSAYIELIENPDIDCFKLEDGSDYVSYNPDYKNKKTSFWKKLRNWI